MYYQQIKDRRKLLRLSQSEVATRAGISLPGLQNIETGKSSPSINTLESILNVLGLKLEISLQEIDWDLLAFYGLPITANANRENESRSSDKLAQLIQSAIRCSEKGRILEALQAFLLAIYEHFPSFYKEKLSAFSEAIYPKQITGRLIKLKRQVVPVLCEYL